MHPFKAVRVALFFAAIELAAEAKDLVIDRVVIKKHPIPAPYYVYVSIKAARAEDKFHTPDKRYGGSRGLEAGDIEIPLKLRIKDVQFNTNAKITLHIDSDPKLVNTFRATAKHSAKFLMQDGPGQQTFVPALYNTPFVYTLFWHYE